MSQNQIQHPREREEWMDTLRFLGIFAIYLGHTSGGGRLGSFVYLYHVPLFFFISGYFSSQYNIPILSAIALRAQRLLVPYAFFSILALCLLLIARDWRWIEFRSAAYTFVFGTRNLVMAGSLWFLPCLFVISVIDILMKTFLNQPSMRLIVSFCFLLISQTMLGFDPIQKPSWFFNVDSALYYVFWFTLGEWIRRADVLYKSFASPSHYRQLLTMLLSLIALYCYFYGAEPVFKLFDVGDKYFSSPGIFRLLGSLLVISTLIFLNISVAMALKQIPTFHLIGRRTLILCGTEDVIKLIVPIAIAAVGLELRITNQMSAIFYALACISISTFFIAPFLEKYFPRFVGIYRNDATA